MRPRLIRAALTAAALLAAQLAHAQDVPAPVMGDDGLYKSEWQQDTFKDLREDMADAAAEDRRLLLMVEQRGCIYCKKMHEEVFVVPEIDRLLREKYYVVQINMFGDVEVTDFDGTALPEKEMVRRWGLLFTPTLMFFPATPDDVPADATATTAAVATMPGAFGTLTTLNLLNWVLEDGYTTDESFQKYHARMLSTQASGE